MTIHEFDALDDSQKGEALIRYGVLLAERFTIGLKVLLFQIDQFYIEAYFNNTYKIIQGLKSFTNDEGLDPYLQQIDITELMVE
jgi:hypothetical protein